MTAAVDIDAAMTRMVEQLRPMLKRDPLMVGIHTGGVWVAERLHRLLEFKEPLGTLDISFYRDDFTRIGMNPQVRTSHLPVNVEDRHLILVDDVLHTGRTIRAAMNALMDFGRPLAIKLAVLVDRGHRELPIKADYIGKNLPTSAKEGVKLHLKEVDGVNEVVVTEED